MTDQEPIRAIYDTPMRRFRCFVIDLPLKLRSSQNVKTKAQDTPLLYVCVPPASNTPEGFQQS